MIISDLNYLEVVTEANSLEGGCGESEGSSSGSSSGSSISYPVSLFDLNTSQNNYTGSCQSATASSHQGNGINVLNPAIAVNVIVPVNSKVFSA